MRHICSWLWRRGKPELLAVVAFLAMVVGLWWGMQPRPEARTTLPNFVIYQVGSHQVPLQFRFSPDGAYLTAMETHSLSVMNTATGEKVWEHKTASEEEYIFIPNLRWTNNHWLFFSTVSDFRQATARWQLVGVDLDRGGQEIFRRAIGKTSDLHFEVAPNGKTLALAKREEKDQSLTVLDVASGAIKKTCMGTGGDLLVEGFSPDSAYLLYVWQGASQAPEDRSTRLEVLDLHSGQAVPLGDTDRIESRWNHAFSADGKLWACGERSTVRVWKMPTSPGNQASADGKMAPLEQLENRELAHRRIVSLQFAHHETWLVMVTLPNAMSITGPPPGPFDVYEGPQSVSVHIYDLQNHKFVYEQEQACLPFFAENHRYLATKVLRNEQDGIRIEDLQTHKEICFVPEPKEGRLVFLTCIRGKHGKESILFQTQTYHEKSSWLHWFQSWWGKSERNETLTEVHFLDPATGQEMDRWQFGHPLQLCLSPSGKQLMLAHQMPDAILLEFYPLPYARPWFHIFGGAVAVSMSIEL